MKMFGEDVRFDEKLHAELTQLRLRAFKSNSEIDKAAYYLRLSQAFQRDELVPVKSESA